MVRDITLDYYNNNAHSFTSDTLDVEFSDIQDRFLAELQPGTLILDFGCGMGPRDAVGPFDVVVQDVRDHTDEPTVDHRAGDRLNILIDMALRELQPGDQLPAVQRL